MQACLVYYNGMCIFLQERRELIFNYTKLLSQFCETKYHELDISNLNEDLYYLNEVYIKLPIPEDFDKTLQAMSSVFYTSDLKCDKGLDYKDFTDYEFALLYRDDINKCTLVRYTEFTSEILDKFTLFSYIKGYNNLSRSKELEYRNFIEAKRFIEIDEIYKKIDNIEEALDINRETLEERVIALIELNYQFNNGSKTKVSDILELVKSKIPDIMSPTSINKIVLGVMKKNNVNKKRFSDGMYYIGVARNTLSVIDYAPIHF